MAIPSKPIKPQRSDIIAKERVRTQVKKINQVARLGGYWMFANGRPIFVRTIGRKVSAPKSSETRNKKLKTKTLEDK